MKRRCPVGWQKYTSGRLTVVSSYKNLNRVGFQLSLWPWKHTWKVKIPYKVACFTWLVAKEAVLTQENLMKRGLSICSRCYLCGQDAETISHLFLHCRVTRQLWELFINNRGIRWTMPGRTYELLSSWNKGGALHLTKIDGKLSQQPFGRQFERRGIQGVLKI